MYPKDLPPQSREKFQVVKSNKDKVGESFPSRLSGVGYFEVPRLWVLREPPSGSGLYKVGPGSTCTSRACGGILQLFWGGGHREVIPLTSL